MLHPVWRATALWAYVLPSLPGVPATNLVPGETIPVEGRAISAIHPVAVGTKSVDWSWKLDRIAFEKVGPRRFFEIYTMRPDGSEQRCLTCGRDSPPRHNGSPSWDPAGKFILFTAEKPETPAYLDNWAVPGKGLNCDLWVMTADGRNYWRLTDLPLGTGRNIPGLIHPQFARDGKKVFWAERLGAGGSWGRWILRVADFVETPEPHLGTVKTFDPGKHGPGGGTPFYESHDFSSDGSKILFSANLLAGQPQHGLDICELDLDTGKTTRLTETFEDWDEHAHYSPDGKKIVWMSSSGLDITWGDTRRNAWKAFVKTDLWMMNADGSGKVRLTYFNQPGAPEYFGKRCIVSDNAWSPDGRRIVVNVAYESAPTMRSRCYVLDVK